MQLDLVDQTARERALTKLADIHGRLQKEARQAKVKKQLQEFKNYFKTCCKKHLKLDREHLQGFEEDELPEIGGLLIVRVAPLVMLQHAVICILVVINLAVPVGFAYGLHPMMLFLACPIGLLSYGCWAQIESSASWSYRKLYFGLKKQFGSEYFPPKHFLLGPNYCDDLLENMVVAVA